MVSPINWAITGFLETSTGLNKKIIVKTDVEVYLTCFVSLTDPEPHLVVRYQRGVRTWCTTKPAKVLWMQYPQTEYADTIYHTFMLPGPLLNLKHWIRFEGTFLGISTISNSPIFKRTKRLFFEPWDALLTTYHPWITSHMTHEFVQPQNGWLTFSTDLWLFGDITNSCRLVLHPGQTYIIEHTPHYLQTNNTRGKDGSPTRAYLQIIIRRQTWNFGILYYYIRGYPYATDPHYVYRSRYTNIGYGPKTIDLHHDLAQLAAFVHSTILTPDIPIIEISLFAQRISSPGGPFEWFRQDYIDFFHELPD